MLFLVEIERNTRHEFRIDARTEEEAEMIAEGMLEDGDEGKLTVVDQWTPNVLPIDGEEE